MKAVVFHGVGDIRPEEVGEPRIQEPTDAIIRITASAICGTDLHMIRGTMATMEPGTVLGSSRASSPLTSVLDAYKAFDTRQPGWLKVELVPGI